MCRGSWSGVAEGQWERRMSSTRLKRRSRRLASGSGAEEDGEQAGHGANDVPMEEAASAVAGVRTSPQAGSKRARDAPGQHSLREKSPKRMRTTQEVGRVSSGAPAGGCAMEAVVVRRNGATGGPGRAARGVEAAHLFKGCTFVLSRSLETGVRERMTAALLGRGATIEEEMREEESARHARGRRFFVQDSNAEDDGRLPEALECEYAVVGPDYVNDCLAHRRLLSVQEQALGMDVSERGHSLGSHGSMADMGSHGRRRGSGRLTPASSVQEKNEACLRIPAEIFDGTVHEEVPTHNREWENCPQSFNAFLEMPERIVSGPLRTTIYIQPLGWSTKPAAKGSIPRSLVLLEEAVGEFLSIFFCCHIGTLEEREILLDDSNPSGTVEYCVRWEDYMYPIGCSTIVPEPAAAVPPAAAAVARSSGARTGRVDRLNALEVLQVLWEQDMPQDTLAVLALTMHDLYEVRDDPNQYWGRATGDGFAVASGFRFIPPQISVSRQFREVAEAAATASHGGMAARRSSRAGKNKQQCPIKAACGIGRKEFARLLNVAAHELCHVFGMDHCSYYKCLMNSCKPDPAELDGTLHLCVICLRKLQIALDLEDLAGRYERLLAFLQKHGLAREAVWFQNRLAGIFRGTDAPVSLDAPGGTS